ncbi:hypothetical protein VNO77_32444 [Canavalia gladiata]|uniref:RRM domain-containing protein n=1 Tax=Canavalia gladiata TaxID=3824 RepID=A0AAN9KSM8_CANGL
MSGGDNVMEDTHVVYVVPEERKSVVMEGLSCNEWEKQSQQYQLKRKLMANSSEILRRKKIFVGGLPNRISEAEFKSYFARFGTIIDVVVMQDSNTGRPRGFGFITFDSEKSVEDVLVKTFYDLNGKLVEVKRVVPKEENNRVCSSGCDNGKRASPKNFLHNGVKINVPPLGAFAPLSWFYNNDLYAYPPNPFCFPHFGVNTNIPYDPYCNIWYMPMMPIAQPFHQLYPYCGPNYAYVGGYAGL